MNKDQIRITITGTGTSQGVPVIGCTCEVCSSENPHDTRLRSSAVVEYQGTTLVIDIGPDFRQQMLVNKFDDVDAVLLTHEHSDHVAGLDDIRPINFLHKKHIPFFGLARVTNDIKYRFGYVFDDTYDYPGRPRIDLVHISDKPFRVGSIEVIPIPIMHGNLDILGFRFGNFAYITDAKTITPASLEMLQGLDVLIINALHHKHHYSHMNFVEAIEMIGRIKPKKAYLTHLSHNMGLENEVNAQLPGHIQLAYDGQQIVLDHVLE